MNYRLLSILSIVLIGFMISGAGCTPKPKDLPSGVTYKVSKAYKKANILIDKGDNDLAFQHMKQAAREGYRNPFLYRMLAKESGSKREFSEGLKFNHIAIDILESGNVEIMLPYEAEILKNEKGELFCSVYSLHSALLYYSGDKQTAGIYAEKALGICSDETNIQASDIKGRVAIDQGRYKEAVDIFNRVVLRSPGFSQGRYFLGKALIKDGQVDEGILYLQMFVDESNGKHPFVDDAKKMLIEFKKEPEK